MHSNRRRTRILIIAWFMFLLLIPLWIGVSVCYYYWYGSTVPMAPIPKSAQLLKREPNYPDYKSYNAYNWYNATYSTPLTEQQVVDFYRDAEGAAYPFGYFLVDIHSATTQTTTTSQNDKVNIDKTIIALEIRWTPVDETYSFIGIVFFPIIWFVIAIIFAIWTFQHIV